MMNLTPSWRAAFRRLVEMHKTDPPFLHDSGEWVVPIVGAGVPTAIIATLPGEWTLIGARNDEDLESTAFSCPQELAVASFSDHFQAGLFGYIAVFPDLQRFDRGVLEALRRCTREWAYEEWCQTGGHAWPPTS